MDACSAVLPVVAGVVDSDVRPAVFSGWRVPAVLCSTAEVVSPCVEEPVELPTPVPTVVVDWPVPAVLCLPVEVVSLCTEGSLVVSPVEGCIPSEVVASDAPCVVAADISGEEDVVTDTPPVIVVIVVVVETEERMYYKFR